MIFYLKLGFVCIFQSCARPVLRGALPLPKCPPTCHFIAQSRRSKLVGAQAAVHITTILVVVQVKELADSFEAPLCAEYHDMLKTGACIKVDQTSWHPAAAGAMLLSTFALSGTKEVQYEVECKKGISKSAPGKLVRLSRL